MYSPVTADAFSADQSTCALLTENGIHQLPQSIPARTGITCRFPERDRTVISPSCRPGFGVQAEA